MATTPTPRSLSQTIGDMVDAYLSKLGIPSLPIGDPILTTFEAAAQSDVRSGQDIFQFLNSIALSRATGVALQRIGADEGLTKFAETPASGLITITDTSFTKKQTTVYQGSAAPIVGSATINVTNALGWPSTGSIYIGRSTNQYEGPLAYTSITNNVSYWTINLAGGNFTQKFHNLGESVVLAQGGDRAINAGTLVQTPQGNTSSSVQFSVLYNAVLPDGETEVNSITVVAQTPGVIGNVAAGAITSFTTAPFTGASVTNSTPFTNGRATEEDSDFRERIQNTRNSRSKATPLAIKTAVIGTTSSDENKRIISASVVTRENYPTTLYIDDGQGYEEKTQGVAYEIIVDSALGGEQYFSLANGRPVAKAFAETTFSAPFNLTAEALLAVKVGGVTYQHSFDPDQFISIGNATAYEIVASINGNSTLPISARTANNGTQVSIFADDDTNEDIEVVSPSSGTDANLVLGFPVGRTDTLRLYKNDRLLNKDGNVATLFSKVQSNWSSMSSGETLIIRIDGVDITGISNTYTITDQDFVNAGTLYTSLASNNSLDSWVQVLNFRIPGVTVTTNNGFLTVTSNRGRSAEASIEILGGTLVTKNMFLLGSSFGADNDYTLNRNLGQIRLETALVAGDRLSAGSLNTRAFVESATLGTINFLSNAELWFCVDGSAQIIKTSIQAGTLVTYSITATPSWGSRVRVTAGSTTFANVKQGDWLIVNDPSLVADQGAYRIVTTDKNTYVEIERATGYAAPGTIALSKGGLYVVRTDTEPQRVTIATGTNYTPFTLAQQLNLQLVGASASVYKTTKLRVKTDSFYVAGDIALVVVNTEAAKMLLPVSSAIDNLTSHLASVSAGNPQTGTPTFGQLSVSTVTSTSVIQGTGTYGSFSSINPGNFLVADRPVDDTLGRWSNAGHISTINNINTDIITLRDPVLEEWLPQDIVYEAAAYALNAQDKLVAQIDGDVLTKRYSINTYRKVKPGSASYGLSNDFTDSENGNLSLAAGFGIGFNWLDFAVYMKARTKSDTSAGLNTTSTILWRYYRWGAEGNLARLQYRYPLLPSQNIAVTINNSSTTAYSNIRVSLPSGPARTGTTIRSSTKIGLATPSVTSGLTSYVYVVGLPISSAQRTSNVTTLTLTLPASITDHGLVTTNQVYVTSTNGSFTSGVKIITARSATTISYTETAADVGATANIGSISNDTAGSVTTGINVIAGDIFGATTTLIAPFTNNSIKIQTLDVNGRYWQGVSTTAGTISSTLTWSQVNDTTKVNFFPINGGLNTAAQIATAVNALSNCPVTAVAVGGGTGVITDATYETSSLGGTDPFFYLTDGINYVRSQNTPVSTSVNFNFTFKLPITATLAANSDWNNEDVRLVPITTANVVNYFNSTATSGLSSVAEINYSADGQNPQISSLTPGSAGVAQVVGGSANSIASTVQTGGTLFNSGGINFSAAFPTSDIDGLSGNMWVELQNLNPVIKVGRITSATTLVSLDSLGNFTLSGTNAWDYAQGLLTGPIAATWQYIKQGRYVQVRLVSGSGPFGNIGEGSIVVIANTGGSTGNSGTFRVVRTGAGNTVFWIENENCIEEISTGSIAFLAYDSILPGDTIAINTTVWGTTNTGVYTVQSIDLGGVFGGTGNKFKFKVVGSTTAVTGPIALGANSQLVQLTEGSASKLLKQILTIIPNSLDSTLSDVKFSTSNGYLKVGTFAGTIMKPVDKLAFDVGVATGIDGYTHNTGLLAEANRVIYGDESDPSTYPGYVAAGAKVNISGPLIKRIQIALGIRISAGNKDDIFDRIKSEVASVVNNTDIGASIAISDIIGAAQSVNGVLAVSVLSPTYSSSSDLISVQPFEKPLILNVDTDVLLALVGE